MARRVPKSVTWTAGQSLSSWVWVAETAPTGLAYPAGMDGAQFALVGTESGADGLPNAAAAQDILEWPGIKVPATLAAGGGRLILASDALRGHGWVALRTETAGGVAQTQSVNRAATWLGLED